MTNGLKENITPVQFLRAVKLLSFLQDKDLAQLSHLGTLTTCEPHSNIIIEGELTWGLYLILSGKVGIFKTNKLTGDSHDIGELKSGSFFGELSLIDDNPRSATVRALEETRLFYISKETFFNFLGQSGERLSDFYSNCVRILVKRLRDLDDNYVVSQYQLWQSALKKEANSK